MSKSFLFLSGLITLGFGFVIFKLFDIKKEISKMATAEQLTTAFDAIDTSVNKLGDDLTKTLKDLTDAIAAGKAGPDLQPFVDRATAVATKLTDFDTAVTTADAGVTPPPTP